MNTITDRETCSSSHRTTACPTFGILSVSVFLVASTMKHTASVERFISLQFLNSETVGRTPWTGDQPVARPLPYTRQHKYRMNANNYVSSGIRTHDPSVRESEDILCLIRRGHCDWLISVILNKIQFISLHGIR
jgi:hypothetical protein